MLFCDRLSCGFWDSVIPHVFSRMLVMRIFGFCDSACIFAHACHADFVILRFCIRFCAWLSCGFWDSVILHVFSCMLVIRILNSCVFTCYFAIGCHADLAILRFCMYFRACLSCGFRDSAFLHAVLHLVVMRILKFCDSACDFVLSCHADLAILRFCMYFRACLSCGFWNSAILHVFSRMLVMRILGFCDSACYFALVCHENLEFLQFRMLFCACLSCEFGNSVILHIISCRLLAIRAW